MRFIDLEHLGQNISGKYFRENPNIIKVELLEIPKVSIKDAFDFPDENDIPF